jgi:hypothetical protein
MRIDATLRTSMTHPASSYRPTGSPYSYTQVNKFFNLDVAFTCLRKLSADVENRAVVAEDSMRFR